MATYRENAFKVNDSSVGNSLRVAFDNLIRRELKVGDPNDPEQIARALADRYQADTRAQSISAEAKGLPFLNTPSATVPTTMAPTATGLDLDQAKDDIEKDLNALLTSNLTKDVRPELEGWQQAIADLIDDGVSSAGQGLDAYSRDRAFAMRRQLGEYARLARLIGALTPELNEDYRNLAQSLDEICAVILVLMGESLANAGFAGGRYLLQVPFSELQARRDAVLIALRNLSGGAQESLNQSTWPRGLDAYRQLYQQLEHGGQVELRSLLSETGLARCMDELVQLASGGSTSGMRKVGATAWGPLNRFQRFVQITLNAVRPRSPALTGFQEALQLFIDGFTNSGGFRLLRIARPTVLLYGLYGATDLTKADGRLMELVTRRGKLATTIDCLTRCACDNKLVKAQIVLDKILFDIDRAIDLYAVGEVDLGPPELRASAYGILIYAARHPDAWAVTSPDYIGDFEKLANASGQTLRINDQLDQLATLLIPGKNSSNWDDISSSNWNHGTSSTPPPPPPFATKLSNDERCGMQHELDVQLQTDRNWRPIVEQMSSGCIPIGDVFGKIENPIPRNSKVKLDVAGFGCLAAFQHGALWLVDQGTSTDQNETPPGRLEIRNLQIPRDLETSWEDIASGKAEVFDTLRPHNGESANTDSVPSGQEPNSLPPNAAPTRAESN